MRLVGWVSCTAGPFSLISKIPSATRVFAKELWCKLTGCLAYVSPFHYSAALILEWPSEGLVFITHICSFWAFCVNFTPEYFIVYFFCCSFCALWTVDGFTLKLQCTLARVDALQLGVWKRFVSVSVLCCGNGSHLNEFKQIKKWMYINNGCIACKYARSCSDPCIFFVPFHTDPALNYNTGNGLVAQ